MAALGSVKDDLHSGGDGADGGGTRADRGHEGGAADGGGAEIAVRKMVAVMATHQREPTIFQHLILLART